MGSDILYSLSYLTIYSLNTFYALGTLLWATNATKNRINKKLSIGISAVKEEKLFL